MTDLTIVGLRADLKQVRSALDLLEGEVKAPVAAHERLPSIKTEIRQGRHRRGAASGCVRTGLVHLALRPLRG